MIDLFAPGAYARSPGGNLERPAEQRPVVDWIAYNVGDYSAADWARARSLWRQAGIQTFPWAHCRSVVDVGKLIDTAIGEGDKVIGLNIEDVVGDQLNLAQVGALVYDTWVRPYGGQVHMATLPWVPNGQGWGHLAFAVAALEIFPDEQANIYPGGTHSSLVTRQCIEHAFDEGLEQVTLMFKTKAPNTRQGYGQEFAVCHSLYTADDIGIGAPAWAAWDSIAEGCVKLLPPDEEPEVPTVPLTETVFPFTGPLYGPSHSDGPTRNRASVKGLKRAFIRMRYLNQQLGQETDDFGAELERAFKEWWNDIDAPGAWTGYGRGSWLLLRSAKLTSGPNKGQYAMDALALKYVRDDALKLCHPIPAGVSVRIGDLHPTAGLIGNWALDFICKGGTKVLAVEHARITKLSGLDPALGSEDEVGIFGWSVHYETPKGYRYFTTHYGTRAALFVGQQVDAGQVLGTVGHWPNDPGRSHLHQGVTSPLGTADAKKKMLSIAAAQRVAA